MTTTLMNVLLGALIAGLGLLMINRMTRQTTCGVRWGVVLIAVGGLFSVFGNIWHWEEWADTVLLGGIATYLLSNMRSPASSPETKWGTRGAYVVATLTILAVVLSWGTARADPIVIPPAEAVEDAKRMEEIYEFCRKHGCTVMPRAHYDAIQNDMEDLRRILWELERPRPAAAERCA